jgi:hypothetical protein
MEKNIVGGGRGLIFVKVGWCAAWVREMSMGYEGCDGDFVGYERGKHKVNRLRVTWIEISLL